MSAFARSVTRCSVASTRSSLRRTTVQPVKALFGKSSDAERKKEEQWEAQQALLAERRAKKERLMQTFNRKEAKGAKAAPEPASKAAPAPKRPAREEVVVEVEEEEPARPTGGNPLSGLLGGLFGKK
ncbi:hypothetical protein HYH02_000367 [Chlamydomonas schloesseri]|uniref:Uncharacterized protein n=1 Tax=Chlamydomonas schloesseri TaxID=2026947 RepID=A0A836BDC2_9CHLO|nr:hypothetical protein HYH02_000367 [Chlamydomonas schloesseri]|eukprot:KAG2454520.1 hypothetical protein HYH02_000367 [Chlamydomonas schloesseri]